MNVRLTGIVLAAGLSRRSAPANKLLLPFGDTTVVRSTVGAMCEAGFDELIVVTGYQRELLEESMAGLPVRCVFAARFGDGMGHSLGAGVRGASAAAGGFAVCPGDLPRLTADLIRRIAREFSESGGQRHVIPVAGGHRGHPVFLGAWIRSALEHLNGDEGARRLLVQSGEAERCRLLEVGDPAIHADVDYLDGHPG